MVPKLGTLPSDQIFGWALKVSFHRNSQREFTLRPIAYRYLFTKDNASKIKVKVLLFSNDIMIFSEIRTVEGSEFLQQALPYWKLNCGAGRDISVNIKKCNVILYPIKKSLLTYNLTYRNAQSYQQGVGLWGDAF